MKKKLLDYIKYYDNIKPTHTDSKQFEKNVRCEFILTKLKVLKEWVDSYEKNRGKEGYIDTLGTFSIEPFLSNTKIKLTDEVINDQLVLLIHEMVNHEEKNFFNSKLDLQTTNGLDRLIHLWKLEEVKTFKMIFEKLEESLIN